jgi:hypothetical protein
MAGDGGEGETSPVTTADAPDPRVLAKGLAPTPFTAGEIRAGCPEGRTIRLLVESSSAAPYVRVNRFVACDEDGATIESWRPVDDCGTGGRVERDRTTWLDLQRHAAFPADATTIEPGTVELCFGTFDCLVYTLESGPRFWFATALPGMPVKYEIPDGAGWVDVTTVITDERPGNTTS